MQTYPSCTARRCRVGRRCLGTLVAIATVLGGARTACAAPKTDVVVLVNGDHVTCEIKSLEHNKLKVSTDHMGTVYIEWDKIRSVQSNQYLLLERTDGSRYFGQLAESGTGQQLEVRREPGSRPELIPMSSVVRAEPIEGGKLINRLDGYVSAGLDYAKASDRGSVDLAGGLSSRTRIREWKLDGTMNLTDDGSDTDSTDERWDLSGLWRRFLANRYFWEGFGQLQRNTELDLNLRTLAGGGAGRYLVQSNRADWVVGTGLAYTHENYTGGEAFNSLEAVLTTSFAIFRYDFPETDITGAVTVLPSLTQSGRYRSEGELRAKYEFVDDLYFELRLYGSYDSKPPSETTEQSDYGFVTSLGYSF
jgi:hypothetical protein